MLTAVILAVTLTDRFAAIANASGGRVGVCVQAIEGGAAHELNGGERFPMQSVYKLPIAMAVLDQVDRGTLRLSQQLPLQAGDVSDVHFHSPLRDKYPHGGVDISVRDLIRAAIVDSDGVASDILLALAGGGGRVTAYLRQIGIGDIDVVATERQMSSDPMVQYKNSATPRAAVALLRALFDGRAVAQASRQLLLTDLADSVPGPNRVKGLLPAGTPVAHKTGTDATRNGLTRATNDIGIISLPDGRHLAIAVFVKDSTADEPTRDRAIAGIARAAYDAWMIK